MPLAPPESPPNLMPAVLRLPRGVAGCDIGFAEFAALADWELPGRRSRVTADPAAGDLTVALRRSFTARRGRITLAADRRWTIECGRGLAGVAIDARHPAFAGLVVHGGTNRLSVRLGEPATLRFEGGASHVEIVREAGATARLRFGGAYSGVWVDGAEHASGRGGEITAGDGAPRIECVFASSAAHVVLRDE
ncbi:MAG TPA: hypothetical protein VNO82_17060 [Solirubrobacteraceae bacterium]|nr:hypothetical protein [Solirubrobacteraceae bacterium]